MTGTVKWVVGAAVAALLIAATYSGGIRAQATAAPDSQQQLVQMQARMKTMQQQMAALQATTDPDARQTLLDAHMKTMQEQMHAMRGMGGATATMMGSMGRGAGMSTMHRGDAMGTDMQMQHRIDMMQMMMEQMMGQMAAMQGHGTGHMQFGSRDGAQ